MCIREASIRPGTLCITDGWKAAAAVWWEDFESSRLCHASAREHGECNGGAREPQLGDMVFGKAMAPFFV